MSVLEIPNIGKRKGSPYVAGILGPMEVSPGLLIGDCDTGCL